jgi:hypothetical protein
LRLHQRLRVASILFTYMTSVFKFLGIAIVVGGLLLWFASVLPPLPKFGLTTESASTQVASPLPAVDDGYVTLSGTVLYDHDEDASIPYIAYALPNGGMRTKQLIFDHGCSPEGADLPCATGEAPRFPSYPDGTPITVTGTVLGDQILVERIST